VSHLAEDYIRQQLLDLPIPKEDLPTIYNAIKHSKYMQYANDDSGYNMEDFVDREVGLTISGLATLATRGVIILTGGKTQTSSGILNTH